MYVETLNKDSFNIKCKELGTLVAKSNWNPDLMIGIKTGGAYVSRNLKQLDLYNDIQYNEVLLQRKGTELKTKMKISHIIKLLPYSILNYMRIIEARQIEKGFSKQRINNVGPKDHRFIDFSSELKNQIRKSTNILLIDDAVDSGKTMLNLKNAILELNSGSVIKTAAITVTFKDPLIIPDYYLYRGILLRFPWSNDYKGNGWIGNE